MDSFELNKIAGAVLGASLFAMGVGILSDVIFHADMPAQPGFAVAVTETAPAGGAAAQGAAAAAPIAERLKTATAEDGKKVFSKCQSCHTVDKGGKNGTGPNLFGVVGGAVAHLDGFAYSNAFKEAKAAGQTWDYDHLDKFLENPAGAHKGTKMSFRGLPRPDERAAVIQFLRAQADSPAPLPN